MNLAAWHAHIESVRLTDNQLGRIVAECERLGLADRAERLAVTAALAGVGELGSTRELTQGQAGRVVRAVAEARDRAELDALLPRPEPVPVPCPRPAVTWADVIAALGQAVRLTRQAGLALSKGDAGSA